MQAREETGKIFVASTIGAAIGSIVALQVNANFWWAGALIGGFIGYLSYEWKEVIRAIPIAARAAFPALVRGMSEFVKEMREAWAWAFGRPRPFVYLHLLFGAIFSFLLTGDIFKTINFESSPSPLCAIFCIAILMFFLLSVISVFSFLCLSLPYCFGEDDSQDDEDFFSETSYLKMLKMHFLGIPKAWGILLWRFVSSMTTGFVRFGWKMFLFIHSERRLLCGMDAMIGACVGYFSGSVLVGALAGGILGVVNYMYVTERVLRPRGFIKAAS